MLGDVDVVFGDRVVMLGALQNLDPKTRANVLILDRMFTHEPAALALEYGDDDFRVLVDRALSRRYASGDFAALYSKWCRRVRRAGPHLLRVEHAARLNRGAHR